MNKKTAFGLGAVVIVLWLVWVCQESILRQMEGIDWPIEKRGQWGDTFGALNALLSAFAFAAVLFTLWSQQTQIAAAQLDQHRQRFDDTFFRLLSLLREVRGELRYHSPMMGGPSVGPRALEDASAAANSLFKKMPPNISRDEIANTYATKVHRKSEAGLGPYFRLIYTILKRIDRDSVLSDAEKIAYANLLRGQLGSPEVNLLALNGLTPASKDLADFLNRFRMLKYLTDDLIRELVAPHYSREAFEGRDD